ncbi:MAG: beta-lactamase family protein [Actinomycetia bacterium]|nr:beta-lactamase family protein [Actinomycetes bacterium]
MKPDCIAELQRIAEDVAAEGSCPSVSWGVVAEGALVHHGRVGNLDDGSAPSAQSVFRIASMTKSFTAATVLALRDEGVWLLDDPVARHAPELASVVGPPGSAAITLRQLLSMASGLATDDAWADRHLDISPNDIDAIYAGGPTFAHLPNSAYEYSNLGYAMIGRAIERATGTRAQQHIDERFLAPLAMRDTTWVQPAHDNWARPYRVQDGEITRDTPDPIGDGDLAPMGGLWTTVADLAKWVAWLDSANSQPDQGDAVVGLSTASRREMQRMHTYIGINTVAGRACPAGYGFGLNIRDDPTLGTIVSHAGGLPGYGSSMRWIAGRGVGVIALSNTFYAPMSVLTMRLLAALHEHGAIPSKPAIAAPAWESAAQRLVDLLNDWDDAVAFDLFEDNVALDESLDRRRAQAAALVASHGRVQLGATRPTSAANGDFDVRGAGKPFRIYMELSPLPGAPISAYTIHL